MLVSLPVRIVISCEMDCNGPRSKYKCSAWQNMQCKGVRYVVLCFVGLGYNMFIILEGGDFFCHRHKVCTEFEVRVDRSRCIATI